MPYPAQRPQLAEALQLYFGIQGHFPMQLVDDVFPFVDLLHLPPDLQGLADVNQYSLFGTSPAGGVGRYSRCRISNESTNRVTVVERCMVQSTNMGGAEILLTNAGAIGTVIGPKYIDSLHAGLFDPAAVLRVDDAAIGPSQSDVIRSTPATPIPILNVPIILRPGWAIQFTNGASNEYLAVTAVGYTRPLSVGESHA